MPVRYVGREPIQKGKTLYEICRQLANAGVGRVVYRQRHADNWPTQNSFFRLNKVIPDKTCPECRKGEAWGMRVFRGTEFGEWKIGSGHKMDWKLVPRHLEEEFCRITDVWPLPKQPPSNMLAPPWLNVLLLKKNGTVVSVSDSKDKTTVVIPLSKLAKVAPRKNSKR